METSTATITTWQQQLDNMFQVCSLSCKQCFCPAMDPSERCNFCGKQFHFSAVCYAALKQCQQQYWRGRFPHTDSGEPNASQFQKNVFHTRKNSKTSIAQNIELGCYLRAKIHGKPIRGLLDTGSGCTLIKSSLADKLNLPVCDIARTYSNARSRRLTLDYYWCFQRYF